MLLETDVTVGNATRKVKVQDVKQNFVCGFIGERCWFMWDTSKHPLPAVKLKGMRYTQRHRKLAKLFIMPVIEELQQASESMLHTAKGEGSSGGSSGVRSTMYVSSYPLWLTERKQWVAEYWRKGEKAGQLKGYRRTGFAKDDEESKKLASEWLDVCSGCIYRVKCKEDGGCDEPKEYSKHKIA